MTRLWRSLRFRLAALGFLGIYVPPLLLFGVILVTDTETTAQAFNGVEHVRSASAHRSPWIAWTVLALAPAAGAVAWWWAGRAVAPINRVRAVARDIGATDLSRRIALGRGPLEVMALAAEFDGMLDRLALAADSQRRLLEETSHELRIPLSVLMTNAEVLLSHPEPTLELYRQGLRRSQSAAGRLQTTVDDLLAEARGRARTLDRRPADLMELARGVIRQAEVLAAGRRMTLFLEGPAEAVCGIDEATVTRAVSNLVDNAIRYGPAGTPVTVAVELTPTLVVLTVADRGEGIPEAEREHVFERFWRGRRDVPGTGLGLPIARQVALAHGGDLTVTSGSASGTSGTSGTGSGPGCVFRLTLRR
ncbi:HAMP domain-containing histidine kinase [Microbispora sp. RL4-1S]|uniref:histidine kinase n=1 Tax=Microbispora oryzae TaxID=2806554 RepID=A0A940WWE8_9ACTN|nr:HAMP domain-containing sensor histidine kinase [Microbispora oryzae]MBP2708660.1 HAMP domain-containing histidine kinase [Microbispora oryzae]